MKRDRQTRVERFRGLQDLAEEESVFFNSKDVVNTAETICDTEGKSESTTANSDQLTSRHKRALDLIQRRLYKQAQLELIDLDKEAQTPDIAAKGVYSQTRIRQLYIINHNIALTHSRLKEGDDAEYSLEQSCSYLEQLVSGAKTTEQHLALSIEHIKLSLQHCVLMSQNGKHSYAAVLSSRAATRLIECFKTMKTLNNALMANVRKKKRINEGMIDFRSVILKEAKEKLEFLSSISPPEKLVSQSLDALNSIAQFQQQFSNSLYTWKSNLENNEKYIRKGLQLSHSQQKQTRNILGITRSPDWVEAFHMGAIMSLSPKSMDEAPSTDPYFILSNNNIVELVVYASAAFFTLSTEIRLRETEDGRQYMNDSMKYLRMNSNEYIVQCKVLHLKAIQLAGRFLPTSNQYISHLISSFNKNYKYFMEQISEEQSNLNSVVLDGQTMSQGQTSKIKSKKKRTSSISRTEVSLHKRKNSCGVRNFGCSD